MGRTISVSVMALTAALSVHGAEPLAVVGSDRMHVTVLAAGAPMFTLKDTLWGAGWNWIQYTELPKVEGGKRVYEQNSVGFYKAWHKEPIEGQYDFRYELSQTGPKTVTAAYTFKPLDADMVFGLPTAEGTPGAGIGPLLKPSSYFRGGSFVLENMDGSTETHPLPPPRFGKEKVKWRAESRGS